MVFDPSKYRKVSAEEIASYMKGTRSSSGFESPRKGQLATPGIGETLKNVGVGIAKEAGQLGVGVLKLAIPNKAIKAGLEEAIPSTIFEPKGTAQKVGKYGAEIASFLAPQGLVLKAGKALEGANMISKLPTLLQGATKLAGKAGIEALAGGGVAAAQQGELNKNVAQAAGVSAVFPFLGGLKKSILSPNVKSLLTKALKPGKLLPEFEKSLDPALKQILKEGKSIENARDFLDASKSAATRVWNEFKSNISKGQENKLLIDGSKISNKLYEIFDTPAGKKIALEDPETFIKELSNFEKIYNKKLDIQDAESLLEATNAKLGIRDFSQNPNKTTLDKLMNTKLAEALREEIDSALNSIGIEGSKFLKRDYGALITIKRILEKRVPIIEGYQPNSLAEQINLPQVIGVGARALQGDIIAPLQAGAQLGATKFIRRFNNPDVLIKKSIDSLLSDQIKKKGVKYIINKLTKASLQTGASQ